MQAFETDRADLRSELAVIAKKGNERQDDAKGLREMMQSALHPLLERERRKGELARVEGGASLGELPRLLDAIAEKGSFSAVVLSDDVGLPLASSAGSRSVDWLAGMAALVLTLVERAERCGQPRPIGVVVHDASNQMLVHRIFQVGGQAFMLTAVARGQEVSPNALDPALGKLERALARPEIHA